MSNTTQESIHSKQVNIPFHELSLQEQAKRYFECEDIIFDSGIICDVFLDAKDTYLTIKFDLPCNEPNGYHFYIQLLYHSEIIYITFGDVNNVLCTYNVKKVDKKNRTVKLYRHTKLYKEKSGMTVTIKDHKLYQK